MDTPLCIKKVINNYLLGYTCLSYQKAMSVQLSVAQTNDPPDGTKDRSTRLSQMHNLWKPTLLEIGVLEVVKSSS